MGAAVCLRCEWRGPAPGDRSCPRCGVPLYVREPVAARAPKARPEPPEAPAPSAIRTPEPSPPSSMEAAVLDRGAPRRRPATGSRLPWAVGALVVGIVAGILAVRGEDTPRDAGPATPAPLDRPRGHLVALPPGLGDLAASEPTQVTFVTERSTAGLSLYRLWRLSLPSGVLRAGPVVGPTAQIRVAPDPHDERLAILLENGDLSVLDGFGEGRPVRVAGDVRAFDFDRRGTLTFAAATQRLDPEDGTSLTDLRYGSVSASEESPAFEKEFVLDYPIRGMTVRGRSVYAWGTEGGRQVLTSVGGARGRPREQRLGASLLRDIGPGGLALVVPSSTPSLIVSPRSRARSAVSLPLRVERVVAWGSGGGGALAVQTEEDPAGLHVTRLDGSDAVRVLAPTSSIPEAEDIGFSPGGRLLTWTRTRGLVVADVRSGTAFNIGLPSTVPDLLGPVAAG